MSGFASRHKAVSAGGRKKSAGGGAMRKVFFILVSPDTQAMHPLGGFSVAKARGLEIGASCSDELELVPPKVFELTGVQPGNFDFPNQNNASDWTLLVFGQETARDPYVPLGYLSVPERSQWLDIRQIGDGRKKLAHKDMDLPPLTRKEPVHGC